MQNVHVCKCIFISLVIPHTYRPLYIFILFATFYLLFLVSSAVTVNGMSLFHPESFVPRTINLNLTTHMLGASVNAFEINARMEGLEMLIGKYLGKTGYLSMSYMEKIFKIPKDDLNRRKRDVDDNSIYDDIDRQVS